MTLERGNLKLEKVIGEGRFGQVFLASQEEWGKVAVKSFYNSSPAKVKKEAEIMRRALASPYLVRIIGAIDDDQSFSIIMECFELGNLKSFLGYLDCDCLARKCKMILDIARGMNFLHTLECPIVHRDLKLQNIYVGREFNVKIGDFGAATEEESLFTLGKSTHLDSFPYDAFEDYSKLDKTWDVYMYAIAVYEIWSGGISWMIVEKKNGLVTSMLRDDTPDIRELLAEINDQDVRLIVKRSWESHPQKRPSFQAIQDELFKVYNKDYIKNIQDADRAISGQLSHKTGELFEEIQRTDTEVNSELSRPGFYFKHGITTYVTTCKWIDDHLAVGVRWGNVDVYEVTSTGSSRQYTLTYDDWKDRSVTGIAVSESMPDSILVVCDEIPYVYQCHQATHTVKKHKIQGAQVDPVGIAANTNTAVIGLYMRCVIAVCSLPDFNSQIFVRSSVWPVWDLSITTDYLLVMGWRAMVVKPLADLKTDLCRIEKPDQGGFYSADMRDNGRQIYATCYQSGGQGCVCYYIWNGNGIPQYVNTGQIINDLRCVLDRALSLSSSGLLAVGEVDPYQVKVYNIE